METVYIDGSFGEGGGQVLRTSLTLTALTGKHLRIDNIRANRPNPGLARQHLTCVSAACAICNARCTGAELRSTTLDFEPGAIRSGEYHFDIGSAGSASLVIQTILPVLFTAGGLSKITVTGGTHNPWAPPFDFLRESFVPSIRAAGFKADCRLLRYGFFPAGGGKIVFEVQPRRTDEGQPIDLCEPMSQPKISAKIYTARLPVHIAQKQRKLLLDSGLNVEKVEHVDITGSDGAGNCVVVRLCGSSRTSVFTGFGSKGKPSEKVVAEVVEQVTAFLESGAAVDHYLADQLLIYMAMQKTGRLTTNELSSHLTTNIEVIKKFLPVDFTITGQGTMFEICCRAL
ncbi:MAG: RNA 3'-terminal phosphate cyclase [Sedimentisphaerales bacterium]|nr:RNA 3'-terminal phosphate cyclase [Sedimentisphaerales bacterium]